MVFKRKHIIGACLCIITILATTGLILYLTGHWPQLDTFQSPIPVIESPVTTSAQLAEIRTDITKPAVPTGACDVSQIKFYNYFINEGK